ncbi:MAG: phytanoyl-CoA dioxygenase family protein [Planctomycetes bacterium]|nr:phytanoyl-CoA dioxygenase family protein [Planctomycetota bacterium]
MAGFRFTKKQVSQFHQDGYVIAPGLFDTKLMDLLLKIARNDPEFVGKAHVMPDAAGNASRIAITMKMSNDVYTAFVHSEKIVNPMEQVLGGEVYHLHHKMMLKEPKIGGAWEWHQDYGYWYNDGYLLPDLASCMIAVDRAYKGNGCLQVLRGSSRMGRIEHGRFGGQVGANPERVAEIAKKQELVYVEMNPGDALFFHCNTLHRSDPNTSNDPRWSLICCYNAAHNPPFRPSHAPYEKLEKWKDTQIKAVAKEQLATLVPA